MYLYRAVDSEGNTIDFYLRQRRNAKAAKRFLKKALASCHATKPRTITADGDKAYPVAIWKLKEDKCLPHDIPLRVKKSLNNIIEQDHRFIKKRIRNMLGLKSYQTDRKMVTTQPPFGVFFNFTSFICLPFVNTEYIQQGGE
ncbi:hypothetical protein BT246_71030 (plasmid) [Bacillus thuringiensis]|uniref:DDE domain-containing protein n=1 Tax=Bacillus thuringiensis TaxID=1428 RepID=A0A9W3SJM3_BACTU|nr:hypothetical protein BT246_71030 [Bacillus thuringiensis]